MNSFPMNNFGSSNFRQMPFPSQNMPNFRMAPFVNARPFTINAMFGPSSQQQTNVFEMVPALPDPSSIESSSDYDYDSSSTEKSLEAQTTKFLASLKAQEKKLMDSIVQTALSNARLKNVEVNADSSGASSTDSIEATNAYPPIHQLAPTAPEPNDGFQWRSSFNAGPLRRP